MGNNLKMKTSPYISYKEKLRLGRWLIAVILPGEGSDESVLYPKQIHGGNIVDVETLKTGKSAADGVLVEEMGVRAGVITADCAPVIIVSDNKAIVLHVSRKSIMHGLLENVTTYISPSEIDHIYIGPHVCRVHLNFTEEGEELKGFRYKFPEAIRFHRGVIYLSLRRALNEIFNTWQVHPDKIVEDGRCTYEQLDLPSYRRWGEGQGFDKHIKTVVWRQE